MLLAPYRRASLRLPLWEILTQLAGNPSLSLPFEHFFRDSALTVDSCRFSIFLELDEVGL